NNQLDSSTFTSTVLEKVIDSQIQAKLAAQMGVAVTDQQIDQKIAQDKTRKEERHVLLIAVEPTIDSGKTAPTDVQKADAKKAANAKISQASYRAAIASEALRQAIEDKIVADDSAPGLQRQVEEIHIAAASGPLGEKAVKVRHILYSPNHDPSNASKVADSDP